jgi:hypothetical protein
MTTGKLFAWGSTAFTPDTCVAFVDRPRLCQRTRLPVSSSQSPVKLRPKAATGRAGSWELEAGNFQLNILQTVVFSFHLSRHSSRASERRRTCIVNKEMVKPHG